MSEHLKKQLAVRLSGDSHKLLAKLAKTHGGKAAAIEAALARLAGANDITQETVIAWIETHTK